MNRYIIGIIITIKYRLTAVLQKKNTAIQLTTTKKDISGSVISSRQLYHIWCK